VLGKDRNYPALWAALQSLVDNEPGFADDFRLRLIGEVDGEPLGAIHHYGLADNLEREAFLPHAEVIRRIRGGHLLLLLVNQSDDAPGRLPSKLYEYLGAKRPVLALSPLRGDAAKILEETRAGELFLSDEEVRIKAFVRDNYRAWKAGGQTVDTENTEAYSRRSTSSRMGEVLSNLVVR